MYRAALLFLPVSLIFLNGSLQADPIIYENALPNINLNQPAGDLRSNIAFTEDDPVDYFDGTDVTFSSANGNTVDVSTLTTWSVASVLGAPLGDEFDSVSLYFRPEGGTWQVLETGTPDTFFDASNPNQVDDSNPNITDTLVGYTDSVAAYETTDPTQAGTYYPLWQNTFTNLDLELEAGVVYQFAVWGSSADADPDTEYGYWFNSYSNAFLSGAIENNASGTYLRCDATNLSAPCFDENPLIDGTWDKGANMNIEIDGTIFNSTPEPSTFLMSGTFAIAGFILLLRNRNRNDNHA